VQEMTLRLTTELKILAKENHGHCMSCGYVFKKGDTTHLGYGAEEQPLYICNSCSPFLKETAVRYVFMPRLYEIPNENTKLWRYMDFTKYVSLLSSKSIYFTRADCFEDIFEGAKGIKKNKQAWDSHYLNFFRNAVRNPPDGTCQQSEQQIEETAQRLLRELEHGGHADRKMTFVNYWHENEYESEAMWRLYSSFLPNAIAIRTTYQCLYNSLHKNPDISIGRVKYLDLNKQYAGIDGAFWHKRKSFEHEREVRAIVTDHNCRQEGIMIPCDLDLLIESVFVSPQAPDWFINVVNDIHEKYSISVKVSKSELIEEPFF
jgi:hypothetical protein